MKKSFNILLIVCMALTALSCSKTKSYTDMLKAEEKAIDRLIDTEGIEVLKRYPANGVFKENQFVKLENGVYLNVIDSGNGKRAEIGKTKILYRCIVSYPMDSAYIISSGSYSYNSVYASYALSRYYDEGIKDYKSVNYGPNSNGTAPYQFTYMGYSTNEASEGLQTPLEYVGDQAKIKLIVPFKRGFSADNNNGEPIYYEILQYKFEENL